MSRRALILVACLLAAGVFGVVALASPDPGVADEPIPRVYLPVILAQGRATATFTPTSSPTRTPTPTVTLTPSRTTTATPTPTLQPGLSFHGHVRLNDAGGPGVAGVTIYRRFATYPGVPVATTDASGYYDAGFTYIPGDETVTVWAEKAGHTFEPMEYSWRHYYGIEIRILDFVALPHTPTPEHTATPTGTATATRTRTPTPTRTATSIPCPDPYEPNDTFETAAVFFGLPISLDNAYICTPTDEDYYSVWIEDTQFITITLTGMAFDLGLEILDSQGGQVLSLDNPGVASEEGWYVIGESGTYVFHVYGHGGSSTTAPYTLDVQPFDKVDHFSSPVLASQWHWLRPASAQWSLTERPGYLRIKTDMGELTFNDTAHSIVVRQFPTQNFDIQTSMDFAPARNYNEAGLVIYQADRHYVKFTVRYEEGTPMLVLAKRKPGNDFSYYTIVKSTAAPPYPIMYLRLVRHDAQYTAYVSANGQQWAYFAATTHETMTSPQIGLGGWNGNIDFSDPGVNADFDWFYGVPSN